MAERPARSQVALSRQVENDGSAAFICAPSPARARGEASDQQRPGIRRGEERAIETPHVAARQKSKWKSRSAGSFAPRTVPATVAHPAGTTSRRDGWPHRSRKNRPPRSRDAEVGFAGTTALWTPPRWRWPSRLQTFRDGCVRTKGQAAASSLQARAKCSTAYWYEPNALAKRADPPLHTVYSGTDPGQYLQLGNLADRLKLARLLFKCNNARLARYATGRQHFASQPCILQFLPPVIRRSARPGPANAPDDVKRYRNEKSALVRSAPDSRLVCRLAANDVQGR
jgi:hypothetical protein